MVCFQRATLPAARAGLVRGARADGLKSAGRLLPASRQEMVVGSLQDAFKRGVLFYP